MYRLANVWSLLWLRTQPSTNCMPAVATASAPPCRVAFVGGEPAKMTVAEKEKLAEKGLSGVRLSCQCLVEGDMTVQLISRLEGSGRPDPGPPPESTIQPDPEWTTAE